MDNDALLLNKDEAAGLEEVGGEIGETKKTRAPERSGRTGRKRNLRTVLLALALSVLLSIGGGALGAYLTLRFYEPAPEPEEEMTWAFPGKSPAELPSPSETPGEDGPKPEKSEVYAAAVPSVVGVRAQKTKTYTYGFFKKTGTRTVTATGTGFFVSENAFVTNAHVVQNADSVKITTHDGKTLEATLLGEDPTHDVAVLRVDGTFPPVTLGTSSSLRVGDEISIIGNPLGDLTYTYTNGVVSYLGRVISGETGAAVTTFQTNAAINEGGSGSPVFDAYGRVVGVASAKYASSVIEGLGFCVPVDDVMAFAESVLGQTSGGVSLGLSLQEADSTLAAKYGIPEGLFVVLVPEGSPAARAGIEVEDVLLSADGKELTDFASFRAALSGKQAGDEVTLRVARKGNDLLFTVTLGEMTSQGSRTDYEQVEDF